MKHSLTRHSTKTLLTIITISLLAGCNNQMGSKRTAEQEKQQQQDQVVVQKKPPSNPQYVTELSQHQVHSVDAYAPAPHVKTKSVAKARMASGLAPQIMIDHHYQPPTNSEKYHQEALNPVFITEQNPVSTFSIDVDTASYTNIRRLLNMGQWPDHQAVRIEEMLNYFDYAYQVPDSQQTPFSVHSEIAPSPWNGKTKLLKIGLQGYQVSKEQLPPLNLVFLIDVSGSMQNTNKLPLLKQAFHLLTKQLRPQDHVAIVTYAGASGIILEPTSGKDKQTISNALDNLSAGGSTNGGAGIHLAYQTAKKHFKSDGVNRVILASDGDFNVGVTSISELEKLIKAQRQSGVSLSILGFGQGNYNDHLTEKLSNIGNGNAYYIDNFNQARKVFSEQLTGTLHTIAKDVKIQVEFNPAYVSEYRLIGYDNRKLANQDFKNDKIDAGDIGAGHKVTAFYEITMSKDGYHFNEPLRYQSEQPKTVNNNSNEIAFVKLRYKKPNSDTSQLISQAVKLTQIKSSFEQASQDFKFAAAVVGFGEQLRASSYVEWSIDEIIKVAKNNLGDDTWGYRREFMQLTNNAKTLNWQ